MVKKSPCVEYQNASRWGRRLGTHSYMKRFDAHRRDASFGGRLRTAAFNRPDGTTAQ